jgi:hypothetical protein
LRRALLKIDYRITVSIGPADLLFESWFNDERIGEVAVPVSWKYFPDEDERRDEDDENGEPSAGPLLSW